LVITGIGTPLGNGELRIVLSNIPANCSPVYCKPIIMKIMSQTMHFVTTSIKGGIFFFLPLVFCWLVLKKAIGIVSGLVQPLAERLGVDAFLGKATLSILVGVVILLLSFVGGLLLKFRKVRRINEQLESFLSMFFPKYLSLRSKVTEINSKVAKDGTEPTDLTVLTTETTVQTKI
jgi:uncharacterized membrane protein